MCNRLSNNMATTSKSRIKVSMDGDSDGLVDWCAGVLVAWFPIHTLINIDILEFLSYPGIPGVRSMGPSLSKSVQHLWINTSNTGNTGNTSNTSNTGNTGNTSNTRNTSNTSNTS